MIVGRTYQLSFGLCVCGGADLSLITRLGFGRTAFKTMEMFLTRLHDGLVRLG